MKFDVLVIGGGHAGIEAAVASSRLGVKTALISMDSHTIGRLSCNPSIGGSAKGHLAKEIDALGGVMGVLADASGIQFKMLNTSKGPAVWSPRSQNDNHLYPLFAQNLLRSTKGLELVQATVTEILVDGDRISGVKTLDNETIYARCIILCGGTFLNGVMYTGMNATKGGRVGEQPAERISDLLASYGIEKGRLKTGTPPRVDARSIDLSVCVAHNGDENPQPFSIHSRSVQNRLACWATVTSEQTHDILRSGFDRSPMFTGLIHGAGPRYCPSIEDKIARFSDKPSHIIVLEPEGLSTNTVYVNGFSTSLPADVQEDGLRTIPGLSNAKILRYGYAVEYDFFFPYQLTFGLETKAIDGLFFAGQINGTSGYEEAASQGLVAGINAALKIRGEGQFTLSRSEAYIGVLIDDLVNKNTEEPYRIFTSLAEYRLLLRIDTVYDRLLPKGHRLGLVSDATYRSWQRSQELADNLITDVDRARITPPQAATLLETCSEDQLFETTPVRTVARRPTVPLYGLLSAMAYDKINLFNEHPRVVHAVETMIRYDGYIQKQLREVERFADNERRRIPEGFDYTAVPSLSTEAREKLGRIKPSSLGQASRIPGVSASDISILSLYLQVSE